ncbi:uncharacterized protein LOC116726570 [Xiphophorus hellerii]|uniref:uncharacterized protein LOC116726570 n=1 Tax=Xiphophorus hellerii TaxID=8084 RepID=UPI0013B3BE93|nr:uncharacterized protein LOC116726570 [Xiphophorus hellerii]XP_032429224.1 uncharacterized protein LOC116726570 [Xiphophorus hellerii]
MSSNHLIVKIDTPNNVVVREVEPQTPMCSEKKKVPFKMCLAGHEHSLDDDTGKFYDSLIIEPIDATQETVNDEGKNGPPERKRKKKKEEPLPLKVWVELRAPIDQHISIEITEMQDALQITIKEIIPETQEEVAQTQEEQSAQDIKTSQEDFTPSVGKISSTENADEKNDSTVLKNQDDQTDCLDQEAHSRETVISTELDTENESMYEAPETDNEPGEKEPLTCEDMKHTPPSLTVSEPGHIQVEKVPDVSHDQTVENVQLENVPEVPDNQTSEDEVNKHDNTEIPIPLLLPCPKEPQPLFKLIVDLQQYLHELLQELWKTTASLPEGVERRTFLENSYECCLRQLQLYEQMRLLQDSEEVENLPKSPEPQRKSEATSDEHEMGHNAITQGENKNKMVSVKTQTEFPETSKLKAVHRQFVSAKKFRRQSKAVHPKIATKTKMETQNIRHQSKPGQNQDTTSDEDNNPVKEVSFWRRFKKAVTPSFMRQYKDKSKPANMER